MNSVLIYVQYLLGSGHLQRIALIARELVSQGHSVCIASGGAPVRGFELEGVEFVQLEPLRSDDLDFTRIVDKDGNEADEALYQRRRRQLQQCFESCLPRVFVVESYPFGRRPFRRELIPLLEHLRVSNSQTVVVCSIRDILQRRQPSRQRETVGILREFFDYVLIHADPEIARLEDSFDYCEEVQQMLVYTGYVAPPPVPRPVQQQVSSSEILVSAGGGAAGAGLYRCVLDSAHVSSLGRRWRVLVGGGIDDAGFEALAESAPDCVSLERNRGDFRELLASCGVAICQAGYNTVMDLLVTGAPAVLVPFEGQGETEQIARARKFEALHRCAVLRESDLDADRLSRVIAEMLESPEPPLPFIDLDGARASADFLMDCLNPRSGRPA